MKIHPSSVAGRWQQLSPDILLFQSHNHLTQPDTAQEHSLSPEHHTLWKPSISTDDLQNAMSLWQCWRGAEPHGKVYCNVMIRLYMVKLSKTIDQRKFALRGKVLHFLQFTSRSVTTSNRSTSLRILLRMLFLHSHAGCKCSPLLLRWLSSVESMEGWGTITFNWFDTACIKFSDDVATCT